MLVYIAATLISCLLAVWCEKRNTDALNSIDSKQRWGALVLCSLPLILVSAARWGVGTDFLYTYLPEFRALQWLRRRPVSDTETPASQPPAQRPADV